MQRDPLTGVACITLDKWNGWVTVYEARGHRLEVDYEHNAQSPACSTTTLRLRRGQLGRSALLHVESAVVHSAPLCIDELDALRRVFGGAWRAQLTHLTGHDAAEFTAARAQRRTFTGNAPQYEGRVLRNEAWSDLEHDIVNAFMAQCEA